MFGDGYVGRPRDDEQPTGLATGDREITEAARRRATRILKVMYPKLFRSLMEEEVMWLTWHRDTKVREIGGASSLVINGGSTRS